MLSHILKLHNYAALMTGLMQWVASEFSRSISDTRAEMGGGDYIVFFIYLYLYIVHNTQILNSVVILLVILTIQIKF